VRKEGAESAKTENTNHFQIFKFKELIIIATDSQIKTQPQSAQSRRRERKNRKYNSFSNFQIATFSN
jgi:hypothetical protein